MIEKKSRKFVIASVVPIMVVTLCLMAGPILYALYVSFHHWDLTMPASLGQFRGLGNFRDAINGPVFFTSLRVTLVFTILTISFELIIGMCIALLLSTLGRKTVNIMLGVIIIPWAIPNVVNGLMWKWILNPYYGMFNGLLKLLGFIEEYLSLLSNPLTALGAIINAQVWKQLPLVIFILFAGLQSIPEDVLEAATVDGASPFRKFTAIKLPFLRPSLLVLLILQTMESIRTFDTIWIMTGGGPGTSTCVISWLTYSAAFREFDLGRGTALSFILTILTLVFAGIYIKFLKTQID